jgi:Ni/Co efflux regulator RcnB
VKKNTIVAVGMGALLALSATMAQAQKDDRQGHTQFDEKDRQNASDWYNQHKDHPPTGFRSQDRLNADQESRLREGAPLDKDLRKKVHSAPDDLRRRLPDPPPDHRYVAIGGHLGLIDNHFQVKAIIHLHDDH